jgi:hypothetical protein
VKQENDKKNKGRKSDIQRKILEEIENNEKKKIYKKKNTHDALMINTCCIIKPIFMCVYTSNLKYYDNNSVKFQNEAYL